MRPYLKKNWPELTLVVSVIIFISIFSNISFQRQSNFVTSLFDLGIMDQTVWNTIHGHIFQLTQIFGTNTVSRFTIHADWLLIILSPLYLIKPSPYTLIFLQVAVVGLGVIPLYLLAKQVLRSKNWAVIISLCYLLNPIMQRAVTFDFHSVTLATTFIIATFYFLYNKRYGWYFFFALLAISTKETAALSVAMIGIYALVTDKKRIIGSITLLLSALWFYILLWHIMPGVRGGGATNASGFLGMYSQFGKTPFEIIKTLSIYPHTWIKYINDNHRLIYFLPIFLPVAFLALFSPIVLLAIPELMINMLSNYQSMIAIYFQYTSIITAFIFIAMIFGLRNVLNWFDIFVSKYRLAIHRRTYSFVILVFIICCLCVSIWNWSLFQGMKHPDESIVNSQAPPFKTFVVNLSSTVPSSASVSTTLSLEPHFSERQNIYSYPTGVGIADYLIIRTDDPYQIISANYIKQITSQSYNGETYKLVGQSGDVYVYKKS